MRSWPKRRNLIGLQVNRLTVIADAPNRGNRRYVVCVCECGNQCEMRAEAVISGGTTSCGCAKIADRKACVVCGTMFRVCDHKLYCSMKCRVANTRTERECKLCHKNFLVLTSSISVKTNASGNFCSRPCYDKWLCNTERTTGRGSRWNAIRREALRLMPYCGVCGTRKGLQVHHIIPYRLTHDNNITNLIPLCHRDHKKVEVMTVEIENCGVDVDFMGHVLRQNLRRRQVATAGVLRRVWNAAH